MKLRDKTYNISGRIQKKIVRQTILWCREFLGDNHRRKTELSIYVGPQPKRELKQYGTFYGCYDCIGNKLNIYPENNKNIKELIQTVIHEYTHFTQPVRSRYYKYDSQYGYLRNPFEVVARKNEGLYKLCWKDIKGSI